MQTKATLRNMTKSQFKFCCFENLLKGILSVVVLLTVFYSTWVGLQQTANAQTARGVIENRAAPVSRRECISGSNAGGLCNENSDCPGSTCQDRNIFNISVAVDFNATAAQITAIKNAFTAGSQLLFDVTDGQAQFGQVTILNNASLTPNSGRGHYWITTTGGCAADTGTWGVYAGSADINAGIANIQGVAADGCIAHEFVHYVFDARDEYESPAVGDCGSTSYTNEDCPDAAQGTNSAAETQCLMKCCVNWGTDLCWGHAVNDNLTNGNHDAPNVTEQSRCRSNRSCWDQVGWSWPQTMLVPAGAPDPGSNGLTHNALVFVEPPATARLVLVLDRSGSMSTESPSRLDRLKTAARDIVELAEDGIELGIVSYSDEAKDEVAIATLGANRSAYTTAINNLTAGGFTNIGDGLLHAYNMIVAAGGVTANTSIILMSDGLNNRPLFIADAYLQQQINLLQSKGLPVHVTCTGDDLGLDSQCSEIGSGTSGSYVDSADAAQLPERFVGFYELSRSRVPSTQVSDRLYASSYGLTYPVEVEAGANAVTFAVLWTTSGLCAEMTVEAPDGTVFDGLSIPLGRYVRFTYPTPGTWTIKVRTCPGPSMVSSNDSVSSIINDTFVVRSYIENQKIIAPAAAIKKVIQPGEIMHICARPMDEAPLTGVIISGFARTPSGRLVDVNLYDDGGILSSSGDEIADDGTYCTAFSDTLERGAYTFLLQAVAMNAQQSLKNAEPGLEYIQRTPTNFERLLEFSATVDDREIKKNQPPVADAGPDQLVECTSPDGAKVILDASKSFDPDGDPLTFTWTGPFGTKTGEIVEVMLPTGTHDILLVADDGLAKDTEGLIITVGQCIKPIAVDIKPGSCPNPINLKDQGVMPFAIMGTTSGFNVTQIDPASVRLSREGTPGEVAPLRWSYEDVATPFAGELCNCHTLKGDGYKDLALKVDAQAVIKTLNLAKVVGQTIPLTITGNLKTEFGGTPIRGQDCIRVLKK